MTQDGTQETEWTLKQVLRRYDSSFPVRITQVNLGLDELTPGHKVTRRRHPQYYAQSELPSDLEEQAITIEDTEASLSEASKHVAGFFSVFLLLTTYIGISVFSTTHLMLLTEASIPLPIIGVNLPLKLFYIFVPVVYVLLHLNLVLHVKMLDEQVRIFDEQLENSGKKSYAWNLYREKRKRMLFPFFISRALLILGNRTSVEKIFLLLFKLTVVYIPIFVLFLIQYQFLPYHDTTITWVHRICLISDLLILRFVWQRREEYFDRTPRSSLTKCRLSQIVLGLSLFISLFILTVPDEYMDRWAISSTSLERRYVVFRASLDLKPLEQYGDWTSVDFLHRNLNVENEYIGLDIPATKDRFSIFTDKALEEKWASSTLTLKLSGRDFSYANFTGSSFFRVDLSSCKLTHAIFTRSFLRDCTMSGSVLSYSQFDGSRAPGLQADHVTGVGCILSYCEFLGVDFSDSNLTKSKVIKGLMVGSNMSGVNFKGSTFSNASFNGSIFERSDLSDVDISNCFLDSVDFKDARLRTVDLVGLDLRDVVLPDAASPLKSLDSKADGILRSDSLLKLCESDPWIALRLWNGLYERDGTFAAEFKRLYLLGKVRVPDHRTPMELRALLKL
ncbi:MAG: pentapeptide repeat-containing protein [Armatimonadetes bacterium]|nr:pentapeptide repeat-containing protein [Armatimonadota bacterium]